MLDHGGPPEALTAVMSSQPTACSQRAKYGSQPSQVGAKPQPPTVSSQPTQAWSKHALVSYGSAVAERVVSTPVRQGSQQFRRSAGGDASRAIVPACSQRNATPVKVARLPAAMKAQPTSATVEALREELATLREFCEADAMIIAAKDKDLADRDREIAALRRRVAAFEKRKAQKVMKKAKPSKAEKARQAAKLKRTRIKALKSELKKLGAKVAFKQPKGRKSWTASVMAARKALGITDFHPVKKGTQLYKKAKELHEGGSQLH